MADEDGVDYSFTVNDDVLKVLKVEASINAKADGGETHSAQSSDSTDSAGAKDAQNTEKNNTAKSVNSRGLNVHPVTVKSKSKATPAERLVISPREIQHFIRMGHSVEELHQQYNVPVEHIQRYATPIQREKRVIVNLFQNLPARPSRRGRTLLNIASEYFDEHGIDRYTASWNATKTGKQPWLITLTYIRDGKDQIARWFWDSKNSIISENDDNSKQITRYYEDATEVGGGVNFNTIKSHNPDTDWGNAENSSLRNITSSLRLRDLDRIKGELDSNFKELEGTAHAAKRTLQTTHEQSAETVSEVIKAVNTPTTSATAAPKADPVANGEPSVMPKTATKPVVSDDAVDKQSVEQKSKSESIPTVNEADEEEYTEVMPSETEFLNTATTVDELNITGQLRAGLKRKRKQRSGVPSWDNVMLPKSNFQKRFDEEGDE